MCSVDVGIVVDVVEHQMTSALKIVKFCGDRKKLVKALKLTEYLFNAASSQGFRHEHHLRCIIIEARSSVFQGLHIFDVEGFIVVYNLNWR